MENRSRLANGSPRARDNWIGRGRWLDIWDGHSVDLRVHEHDMHGRQTLLQRGQTTEGKVSREFLRNGAVCLPSYGNMFISWWHSFLRRMYEDDMGVDPTR